MHALFEKALRAAGYEGEPTAHNVIECFKDYVDSGIWSNLELFEGKVFTDNGEAVESVIQMAKALIHL